MRKPSKKTKGTYKGPYNNNPNLAIQTVKKSMRPTLDGPTVDTFSTLDTTTNTKQTETDNQKPKSLRTKRPTKEKVKKNNISAEWILGIAFTVVSAIVGIVIYNHSNKFVAVEKDIDYIKDNAKDQKDQIEKVSDQTISIDKKIDMLNQKIDLRPQKK